MEHLHTGDYIVNGRPVPLVLRVDGRLMLSSSELCANLFPHQFRGWKGRLALIVDESRTLQSANSISSRPGPRRKVSTRFNDVLIIRQRTRSKNGTARANPSWMKSCSSPERPAELQRIEDLCGTDVAEVVGTHLRPKSEDDPCKHHFVRYSFSKCSARKSGF